MSADPGSRPTGWRVFGHPIHMQLVHFPIALLTVALPAQFLYRAYGRADFSRYHEQWSSCSHFFDHEGRAHGTVAFHGRRQSQCVLGSLRCSAWRVRQILFHFALRAGPVPNSVRHCRSLRGWHGCQADRSEGTVTPILSACCRVLRPYGSAA